jgi:hypothetical protein
MTMPTPALSIPSKDVSFMAEPEDILYCYYAIPVNGDVHMVVPSKTLRFLSPAVLQGKRIKKPLSEYDLWMDPLVNSL